MNNKAQGIILSVSDYRDNDLICQVLFKEYGLLSIVAKGAKKITSKNAYSLLPASLSEMLFDYKDHKKPRCALIYLIILFFYVKVKYRIDLYS